MSKNSHDFQNTLVAFFDIQGYSAFVSNEPKSVVVEKTKKLISSHLATATTDLWGAKFESLVLSDSLIIAVNTTHVPIFKGSVHFLLATCSQILADSLKFYKIPLRGAIGGGWFYKENEVLVSSALVEAATYEKNQEWYGMVVATQAEKLMLEAFESSEEFQNKNDGFVLRGKVPWKKNVCEGDQSKDWYYIQPFETYFQDKQKIEFPSWFKKDDVKVKNSNSLYCGTLGS